MVLCLRCRSYSITIFLVSAFSPMHCGKLRVSRSAYSLELETQMVTSICTLFQLIHDLMT